MKAQRLKKTKWEKDLEGLCVGRVGASDCCFFVCLFVCLFGCLFVCLVGWLAGWFVDVAVG